jgi:hypothetical protein
MVSFVIGIVGVNMGIAVVSAPFTALIPDLVAPSQYGAASGFMGLQTMLGNAIGAGVLGLVLSSLESAFGSSFIPLCVILCLLLVISLAVTLIAVTEVVFVPSLESSSSSIILPNTISRQFFVALFWKFIALVVSIWREFKGFQKIFVRFAFIALKKCFIGNIENQKKKRKTFIL